MVSAVNIQHIESLNEAVKEITGVEVTERVPDSVLQMADEVVNIDLTADELITRLRKERSIPAIRYKLHSPISSERKRSSSFASWP